MIPSLFCPVRSVDVSLLAHLRWAIAALGGLYHYFGRVPMIGSRKLRGSVVQLRPRMRGVAPAAAEFQIDPHRHLERHGLAAQAGNQFALFARRHRAIERIVHLQERDNAFAPHGAHPELGVTRRRALDQCIQGGVNIGAPQPRAEPGMRAIGDSPLGLLERTGAGAFDVDTGRLVIIPMPAGAVT